MREKLCIVGVILLFQLNAHASPAINITTRFYPVEGNDLISIQQSILKNGPIGESNQRFHAVTRWNTQWSYRWIETNDLCRLQDIEVNVDIEYVLPRLKTTAKQTQSIHRSWQKYYSALFKHEQQHKDYGVQAATEIERRLLAINKQMLCSTLQSSLTNTAQQVLKKYDRLEKEFDKKTNHGINQGVRLEDPRSHQR